MDYLSKDTKEIYNDINENVEQASSDIVDNQADKFKKYLEKKEKESNQRPFYFDFSWQIYRAIFLAIIFVMIFFLKGGEMFLKSRKFDKFLINVYVIISFFLLINLCIYFFMVTNNRYRSTLKGPKRDHEEEEDYKEKIVIVMYVQ